MQKDDADDQKVVFTPDEDRLLKILAGKFQNDWAKIAKSFVGRHAS